MATSGIGSSSEPYSKHKTSDRDVSENPAQETKITALNVAEHGVFHKSEDPERLESTRRAANSLVEWHNVATMLAVAGAAIAVVGNLFLGLAMLTIFLLVKQLSKRQILKVDDKLKEAERPWDLSRQIYGLLQTNFFFPAAEMVAGQPFHRQFVQE